MAHDDTFCMTVFFLISILVSIFGYCWQTGEVGVHSPYIYRSAGHIQGSLGIRIGIKTVNLTLKGRQHIHN